jgi:hypothetical protein
LIIYINGDSHAAAAEAANTHAFAEDDKQYFYLGRIPHPDNAAVSWGKILSTTLRAHLHQDAESASSNARILRTSRKFLEEKGNPHNLLMIIQWSTWEREEWLIDDVYYQIGASGQDQVPEKYQQQYKEFVATGDWTHKTQQAHDEIWQFHLELEELGIAHVFFNGNNNFSSIKDRKDWGINYIGPYDPGQTYDAVIRSKGIDTVAPNSWHFGRDGHQAWHKYMLQYLIKNKLV